MNVSLWKLFLIFFRIGAFTFGGGYVMIPIIQHEISEKYKLVPEKELSDLLVLAQSLPGVLAVNAATSVGYKLYGKKGAVICAIGVALPSFLIIVILANLILQYHDNAYVLGAFRGMRAVVVGMIFAAAVKMGKDCFRDPIQFGLLAGSFLLTAFLQLHPIVLIIIGGIMGWVLSKQKKTEGGVV